MPRAIGGDAAPNEICGSDAAKKVEAPGELPSNSKALAEVAEWQTRRIQKTSCDEPTDTEELRPKVIDDARESISMPVGEPAARSDPPTDPIEVALTAAIVKAAEAARFDVVIQLARELEARRLSRAGNVVSLRDRHSRDRER